MNDRDTVNVDREFYEELTREYYAKQKKEPDCPTSIAVLITILIIAVVLLAGYCMILNSRLYEVERTLEQAGMLIKQVEIFFN